MPENPTDPVRVMISYSHDSEGHRTRALSLADRLRNEGIHCEIDQYYEIAPPPEGWPRWMDHQIASADFVLVVCTPIYFERFSGIAKQGEGLGSKWEGAIITQAIYDAEVKNSKFIPVVFDAEDLKAIPNILRMTNHYNLDKRDDYEKLYRRLTDQPAIIKPTVGPVRSLPPVEPEILSTPGNAFTDSKLDLWVDESLKRWRKLVDTELQAGSPFTCQDGYVWVAYRIRQELKISLRQLSDLLEKVQQTIYSSQPPWFVRKSWQKSTPRPINGVLESWLARDENAHIRDPAHGDFWRAAPAGFFFFHRGFAEDSFPGVQPGATMDLGGPIRLIAECLLHAHRLVGLAGMPTAEIAVRFGMEGLAGRVLKPLSKLYRVSLIFESRTSHQESFSNSSAMRAATIEKNLPQEVHRLLAPLYELFELYDLPLTIVEQEVAQLK